MSPGSLEVLPAIDLRGGKCVRLLRGDFEAETVYDDDPVRVARGFEAEGARWIHVVDLDAARTGEPANLRYVLAIAAAVSCRIEASGGVRTRAAATELLDAGAARVVVGTAAVESPELVDELEHAYEEGDRARFDADLATWRGVVERRTAFLERHGLVPLTTG